MTPNDALAEAQARIKQLEKELEKALNDAPTPEAVYSLTADRAVFNKFGTTWKPTFRSRQGETAQAWMHRIDATVEMFLKDNWQTANGDSRPAPQTVAVNPANAVPGAPPPMPEEPPLTTSGNGHSINQSFTGGTLLANVEGNKAYWKIKGGRWEKFGVTVYPETLTQFISALGRSLNPLETYDLNGWTSEYVLKDDGSGKPWKVVKLYRGH